jgi:hypothetical protein
MKSDVMRKRGLFVLHEGIPNTIFRSQILEHVNDMERKGFNIDILSFNTESKIWDISESNLKDIQRTYPNLSIVLKKGVNIYIPFSRFLNFILFVYFIWINKKKYSFIHARANYSAFLSLFTKLIFHIPVVWDCRGDSVDELKDALYRKGGLINWIGMLILLPWEHIQIFFLCRMANAAVFVSKSLLELYKNKLKFKIYNIIPCPVSEKKFFFDATIRDRIRHEFCFSQENTVFLYSGSMVSYQSQVLQKDIYEKILEKSNTVILYITSDKKIAKEVFSDFPENRFVIFSSEFDEMNNYYNAADFAILLRDPKQLNKVASPTKFGEYCLAGLPVIMNNTVDQAVENAHEIENYISYKSMKYSRINNDERTEIAMKARNIYSREILNEYYCKMYENITKI